MIVEKDFAGQQSRGARDSQEDSYAFLEIPESSGDMAGLLVVVADGMGGHNAGERASELALQTFVESFHGEDGDINTRLRLALDAANQGIARDMEGEPDYEGMGTTLVAAYVTSDAINWISVGDSPLYLWRAGELTRLNEDHSLRPVLGEWQSEEKSPDHGLVAASRNILRAALTGEEIALIDQPPHAIALERGDIIIAASDGIHTLKDEEIARVCEVSGLHEAQELAGEILRLIKEAGYARQDNTTVAIVKIPTVK